MKVHFSTIIDIDNEIVLELILMLIQHFLVEYIQ